MNRTAGKTDTDDDEYYGVMGGGASGPGYGFGFDGGFGHADPFEIFRT